MRSAARTILLLAAVTAVGCGAKPHDDRVPVYPVEGRVVVGGRAAGGAKLMLHPLARDGAVQLYPVGVAGPDGTFRLTTRTAGDGAPAGEYVITLIWPNDVPFDECTCTDLTLHDRLRGLYADPATSALRATVRPERNEIVVRADAGGTGWNLPRLKDAAGPAQ